MAQGFQGFAHTGFDGLRGEFEPCGDLAIRQSVEAVHFKYFTHIAYLNLFTNTKNQRKRKKTKKHDKELTN